MGHVRSESVTEPVPPLQNGDRLTRDEFERRYSAMPHVKKAELINGVVYVVAAEKPNGALAMSSPVNPTLHGSPHLLLGTWLGTYYALTPGTQGADNGTVRLPSDSNEPQPDLFLRILPECGGRTRTAEGGWVEGAPELAAEIAASSAAFDLHDKLAAFEADGVREYIVWRVEDRAIDWFVLRRKKYRPLQGGPDGIVRSDVFRGLWLDVGAMLAGDHARWMKSLQDGISGAEHAHFVERLRRKANRKRR